jgi:hypothetical protein
MSIQFRPIKDINLYKSYLTRKYEKIYDKNIEIYKNADSIIIISKNGKDYEQCGFEYDRSLIRLCYLNIIYINDEVYGEYSSYYIKKKDIIKNINILYSELENRGIMLSKYKLLQYFKEDDVINDYMYEYNIYREIVRRFPIIGIRDICDIIIEYVM